MRERKKGRKERRGAGEGEREGRKEIQYTTIKPKKDYFEYHTKVMII